MRASLPARLFPDAATAGFLLRQACQNAAGLTGVRLGQTSDRRRWNRETHSLKTPAITRHFSFRLLPDTEAYRRPSGRIRPKAQVPYAAFVNQPRRNKPRRTNAVCWHGHRDFLRALFSILPDLVVKTTLITYRGRDDFEATFHTTLSHHFLDRQSCDR